MTPSRPAALIVEDQPFIGLVASDILRESGFDTFHAYDAVDAKAATASPTTIPAPINIDTRARTRRITDPRVAPSAIRMPISVRLRFTAYEVTP